MSLTCALLNLFVYQIHGQVDVKKVHILALRVGLQHDLSQLDFSFLMLN